LMLMALPTIIPDNESGRVRSRAARIHILALYIIDQGNFGYFLKFGLLFSKKAFFPS